MVRKSQHCSMKCPIHITKFNTNMLVTKHTTSNRSSCQKKLKLLLSKLKKQKSQSSNQIQVRFQLLLIRKNIKVLSNLLIYYKRTLTILLTIAFNIRKDKKPSLLLKSATNNTNKTNSCVMLLTKYYNRMMVSYYILYRSKQEAKCITQETSKVSSYKYS